MNRSARPQEESPQAQASDPKRSAWVSANAGSGKTTVLVWRVIRLLLDDVAPARILCLTYTKAAAAHMANEVLKTLSKWVRLDDEALDKALAALDPIKPDAARRAKARRLFAAALETPGGLKVQTIHAFCDRVLHMFPVEAQVPAGFEVLDELGESDLIERARLDVLLKAGNDPDGELGRAFRHCIEICGDEAIENSLREAVQERQKLLGLELDAARHAISAALGLSPEESIDAISRTILDESSLRRSEWAATAATLISLGGNAKKTGELLDIATRARAEHALDKYLDVFVTKTDRTLKAVSSLCKAADLLKFPALGAQINAECARLGPLIDKLRAARERERSLALLTLANAVIERYEAAKRSRGALDFTDLVTKTVSLVEREASAWVHYKLDGGIEHILVDEAQDTSPEQWRIIGKLAEEFFAGLGATEKPRTIFAVGDEKQSIFSFQGADPKSFDEMRRTFDRRIAATGGELGTPELKKSFRSTEVVLNAVDTVFKQPTARRGLSARDEAAPIHEAVRAKAPGVVEIWPLTASRKTASDDELGWDAPLDSLRDAAAPMVLARQIAAAVKFWTEGRLSVGIKSLAGGNEERRPARAGDIIVLVQRRGTLFNAILRALKQAGLPVAGADRLALTEHIAIMDLMALGDALLLQRDDLQLACALKSPLFGLTDDDLFKLAHGRAGTLAQNLIGKAAKNSRFADAARLLARWREEAKHLRPFDFYSRVLGRDGGRKKMIARLGIEAADALDEFLSRALVYEATETPSLQGLLGFLRRAGALVKRDLETESSAVRVMTVHGVKGLEAPMIVLADTTTKPFARFDPKVMPAPVPDAPPGTAPAWIWAMGKKEDSTALSEARRAARDLREQEYRRLLYVALTRAADVLVVCGMLNDNQKAADENSWYDLVTTALEKDDEQKAFIKKVAVPYHDEEISRWRDASMPAIALSPDNAQPNGALPGWVTTAASEASKELRRLRPSLAAAIAKEKRVVAAGASIDAMRRGVLIHRLLQSLPTLPEGERVEAAGRYLKSFVPEMRDSVRNALASEAIAVISHPDCAELFCAGSRAEAECIARVALPGGEKIEIAARLDRLAVTGEQILFADFKSDTRVPATAAKIPANYVAQLAAYRTALSHAFPGRRLRGILIFTAGPQVFEIGDSAMEESWNLLKTHSSPAVA